MTTIKTLLPRKPYFVKGRSIGGDINEIYDIVNQLIDRVAELSEVVEGKQTPTLKEQLLEEEEINIPGFEGTLEALDKISIR